jgi:methylmalonyl-CoA mutase, N-terminal domain
MGNANLRKEKFTNLSDMEIGAFYTAKDSPATESPLPLPGDYPYTRGVQETMYRGRLWTMRQYAGFGSAKDSNERYKHLLKQGTKGLSVAFDLPTQMGYDSDHVMSIGEVGKVGVAISSIEDMEILLNDLPLDKISTSMTINATGGILLALYAAVARRRGISFNDIRGTIQNDILKEYIARGTYIFPPKPSMRIITDIFDYCSSEIPKWNTISISGYHIREAGSNAIQEVAFTLANGMTYVQAAIDKGLDVNTFGQRLSFFFNVHNDFFEEIAKFRAARTLWAKIMKDHFGATNEKALKLRFHSQTAGCTLTAQQPENNIARVTIQALASVLGGTQSLHTNSMDEALGLPTEKSATIALRTQQVIAHESGVTNSIDPLAGSYYVENLTKKIEDGAKNYLDRIKDLGGVIKCIETGWIQNEIQNSAYKYQLDVDNKDLTIIGVNDFVQTESESLDILKISEQTAKEQIQRLTTFKKNRDAKQVKSCLDKIQNAAKGTDNLLPLFIEAVDNNVTMGEISDALRKVFGQYKEKVIF